MEHLFVGGPFDGQRREIPAGTSEVVFPLVGMKGGRSGRSLAELEPEIRFDYETGAIVAPAECVLEYRMARYRMARYRPDGDRFTFVSASA